MANVSIEVKTLYDDCLKCPCLEVKETCLLHSGAKVLAREFACANFDLCRSIRGRLIDKEKEENGS